MTGTGSFEMLIGYKGCKVACLQGRAKMQLSLNGSLASKKFKPLKVLFYGLADVRCFGDDGKGGRTTDMNAA